jgi:hypothetical protein
MSAARPTRVRHKFVDAIPESPAQEVLYISIERKIAVHRCLCGCGQDVATPLAPKEWHLSFDGETVSLFPSVGVWGMPCQSHYWIENDRVYWAGRLSAEKIERLRRRERREAEGAPPEEMRHSQRRRWFRGSRED